MRKILAVILGAVVSTTVLLMVGVIANTIQPTPPELMDTATPEAVAERVASATMFTWLSTIFGHALGAFLGGIVGAIVAKEKIVLVTGIIGFVCSLWAFYTFYIVFPTVLWVPIAMLISAFLFSYFGGNVIKQAQRKGSAQKLNKESVERKYTENNFLFIRDYKC